MNKEKASQFSRALIHAISKNLPEVAELLLNNGADANSKSDKYTSLMLAAGNIYFDNSGIVKILLEKGVSIDEKNCEGWTALMLAIRSVNEKCVKVLLDNGADINLQKKDGHTALTVALFSRQYDLIKLLLESGADTNIKSKDGTALDITLTSKYRMMAGDEETENVIQLLLNHGATAPLPDEEGTTFLMKIIYRGFVNVANYLLTTGVDLKEADKVGRTAATFAEFKGLTKLAQRLRT